MSEFSNTKKAINNAMYFIQATWQQAVMGAIQIPGVPVIKANVQLRQIYADSIIRGPQLNLPNQIEGTVLAVKQIAKDLEDGKGPFDMKPALLNGPKARVSKKGVKFNIIPFRQAVPGGTSNSNVGRVMPQSIYQLAKKLKSGGRLTGTEVDHPPGSNKSTGYQHKNGIYEGLTRVKKTYAKATQSKYLTFRIVSANSDPQSWWHPGYPAYHIAREVASHCRPEIEAMINEAAVKDITDIDGLNMTIVGG